MRRGLVVVLPAAWLLTVAATPATAPRTPTPTPNTGVLSLDPTFGPPGTKLTVSGSAFQPNQAVQLYFDAPANALPAATADASGSFKVQVDAPDAAIGPHTICSPQAGANTPCASFRLEPKPSPSPSATPSPSPTPAGTAPPSTPPSAAPTPDAPETTAVGLLTRPPFVFFPILLIVGALLSVAWILWGRRAPAPPARATVRHASTPPSMPVMPAAAPPAAAPPEPPEPPRPPRATPGDESIDLPDPGD